MKRKQRIVKGFLIVFLAIFINSVDIAKAQKTHRRYPSMKSRPHEEVKKVAQVNQLAPVAITKALFMQIKRAILYVGSVAEDAQFSGSSSYVSSKQGLHGFAASFAAEALSYGIRSIYFMIGVMDGGMAELLSPEQIKQLMITIGQKKLEGPKEIAEKIVNSLTRPKIMGTSDTKEGVLVVRRDGYKI